MTAVKFGTQVHRHESSADIVNGQNRSHRLKIAVILNTETMICLEWLNIIENPPRQTKYGKKLRSFDIFCHCIHIL